MYIYTLFFVLRATGPARCLWRAYPQTLILVNIVVASLLELMIQLERCRDVSASHSAPSGRRAQVAAAGICSQRSGYVKRFTQLDEARTRESGGNDQLIAFD